MPKLICHTHSSHDSYNGDCDYMVINMDPSKAKKILYWMDLIAGFKNSEDVYSIQIWTGHDGCYSSAALSKFEEIEAFEYEDFYPFPPADNSEFEQVEWESTDCHLMEITSCTVQWTCNPKHDTTLISSVISNRKEVETWAKGEFDAS